MKTLVNGGLNLSELDGWWAEAYRADVGWAIGDGREHDNDLSWDAGDERNLRWKHEMMHTDGMIIKRRGDDHEKDWHIDQWG